MKKLFITLMGIAAVAAVACQPKEEAEILPGRWIDVNLTAQQPDTRTYIEETQGGWQPYWSPKDSIVVTLSTDVSKAYTFRSSDEKGALTGSFTGKIEAEDGEMTIYAYRPKRNGRADNIYKFDISNQQIPSLGTFDPTKDILIADPAKLTVADQHVASSEKLHFNRILSVIQILVADGSTGNKLAGKAISSVKLTSSAVPLSGRLRVDITTGKIDQWESNDKYNYVTASYAGNDWTAGSSTGAMILTAPATLSSGSSLALEITTVDGAVYSREVNLSNDVALEAGKVYTFRFTFTDSDLAKEVESLKPVTETTTWSSTFAKCIDKYGAGTEVTTDFILDNLGFVAGGSKFKFGTDAPGDRVQLGGTGAAGTKACVQFMVAGNGKLTLTVRSSGDAARPIVVAVGSTEVGRKDAPGKGSDAGTFEFDITASNGDLINIFSASSAINIYEIKWVPEGSTDTPGGGDNPVDPQPGEEGSWDFSESAWQNSFATYGAPASTDPLSNYDNTIAGLTVKAEAFKYGDTYFQMAKAGSNQANYFKFTVAEAGVVSVVASHTGSTLPNSDRYCTVYNNSTTASVVASVSSKSPKTCNFNVAAGDVYVYTTSENVSDGVGMRFYKIYFTAGASVDPENPVLPDEAQGELEIPADQKPAEGTVEIDKLYGFAQAAGVTGGDKATSANILHFDNGKALQTWLLNRTKSEKKGDNSPVTIWLSGTFGPGDGRDFSEAHPWFDVKDVSNLSFYGTDGFVMDRIGIFCVRASNIIIRNINFQQPKANNGADAVSMQECDGVWVDHCTFTSLNQTKDYEDGSTDVTHGSKNVTVSWCHYIKTQKSCLVGHSNNQSSDVSITATFHHNWFDGSSSRHPRVRFGRAHVYNNLFDGCTTYGVGSAYGAKVLVEYNYFDGVQLPTDICSYPAKENGESNLTGSVAGYLFAGEDILVNRPAKAKDPYPLTNLKYKSYNGETLATPLTYADFKPGYSYVVTPAENVPEVVKAGAGYGKLGWAEAPVAVNNGGVNPSEYNGTDEDPTDPDPGSGEEPGTPAAGLSEGWSWVNNNATTATYAVSDGKLNIASTGKWESKAQGFGFAYREVTGDFTATVELVSYEPLKNSNQAVAGLMAVDGSVSATATDLLFAMGGKAYGNARTATGKEKGGFNIKQPEATGGKTILRLKREGDVLKVSLSLDGGATFGEASSKDFSADGGGTGLSETLKVGLACNSGDNSKQSTAVFANFTINDTVIAF